MKKIFNILVVAAVALGAVACQNNIEENATPAQGESLSISVTIADQTRVALGEFEEGKGYKLSFEEGDQLCVSPSWGGEGTEADYWFTYTKTEGDTYVFTCTADGVSALVGTKQNIFYFGGAPAGNGSVCNTAKEDISGVGMNGGTDAFGTETITLSALPVLKYSSEYPVTFTASMGTFSSEAGRWATSYTATKTGTDIYIPMYTTGTYTLTASIKGQEVKSKEITFEKNKIYNLGTLEAVAEEQVDGDPAGIAIAIDGSFDDWDSITKNVTTLPDSATERTNIKTLKAYVDANHIYGYVEFAVVEDNVKFVLGVDLDNDSSTGDSNWLLTNAKGCELMITSGTFIEENTWNLYSAPFAWAAAKLNGVKIGDYASAIVESSGAKGISEGLAAVEFAIAREQLNASMTSSNIGLGITTYGSGNVKLGTMPYADNSTLVIPVYNE